MKRVLVFAAVVGAALAAWFLFLRERLPGFMEWVRGQGVGGGLIVAAAYVAATVLMVPGSLITLFCGAVYGALWGVVVASPASVLGATLAFLLGRTVFRNMVEERMKGSERFEAVQRAIATNGFKFLVLLRLSPVFPFSLLNYAFGLTRLRTSQYVLGSFVGMLPGTILYVYLGSTIGDLAAYAAGEEELEPTTASTVLKWVGLAVTLLVTVLLTRAARRELSRQAPDAVEGEGAASS